MKKYLLCILVLLSGFLLVGCGKYGEKDIVNDLNKKISKIDNYYLNGLRLLIKRKIILELV